MIKHLVLTALLVSSMAAAQPAQQPALDPQKEALMQIIGELTLAQINWRTEVNALRTQVQMKEQQLARPALKPLVHPEPPARLPDTQLVVPTDPP